MVAGTTFNKWNRKKIMKNTFIIPHIINGSSLNAEGKPNQETLQDIIVRALGKIQWDGLKKITIRSMPDDERSSAIEAGDDRIVIAGMDFNTLSALMKPLFGTAETPEEKKYSDEISSKAFFKSVEFETKGFVELYPERDLSVQFTYHKPLKGQAPRYEILRNCAGQLADIICKTTPASREQSLALTKLEEAVFWANAGIARNEKEEILNITKEEIEDQVRIAKEVYEMEKQQ